MITEQQTATQREFLSVSRRDLAANYPLVRLNSLRCCLMFLSPLFAFDLRPFLCALCNPENLKLNLSRTMSLVITHEIKWTRIPVTGFFSFSCSSFWKVVFIRSVAVCLSLSLPLRLVLSASVWLSLLNGWHAACYCCCCCCGQEALKMNSKTVDAGKLKTELSRLLFALFCLMSFYFLLFFFCLTVCFARSFSNCFLTRWIVQNAFCLSASLRRHVKHIWVECGGIRECPVACGLRNWPST